MIPGRYKVSFYVDLNNCANEDEAREAVGEMVNNALEDDQFPEIEFELEEALDLEYNTDQEVEELNFS